MAVPKWEYRTNILALDKLRGDYTTTLAIHGVAEEIVGLETILTLYGAYGWELVSLTIEKFAPQKGAAFGTVLHYEVLEYRATFKRPLEEPN